MLNFILIIITFISLSSLAQENGFVPYKLDKKWVVLNDSCQIVSKEKYDTICLMSGGLARVKQKNKWGYINRNYLVAIPIVYDTIGEFDTHEGALICRKGKWGYIGKQNQIIIPTTYDKFENFNEIYNDTKVQKNDSSFYINRKGQWVDIKKTRNFGVCKVGRTSNNFMARVIKNKNGLYGLFSEGRAEGNDTLLPCEYKKIESIYASIFSILIKDKYSLYNTVKSQMVLTDCDTIGFYYERKETYWVLYRKKGITGFIHPYGDQQTEIDYKAIKIITGNFIYITDSNNKSYYINYKGKKYIPKTN